MGANEFVNKPHIGESVRRVEDARFITGQGNYVDDIVEAGQKYAAFVRSTYPHARLTGVDTSAAEEMPGVIRIFTGKDIAGKCGGLPAGWMIVQVDGAPMKEPQRPFLAIDKVRYVGEPVAMVVADTKEQAQNAIESVMVDYDPLDPVIDVHKAANGPALHAEAPDNRCYKWGIGDKAGVDAAFTKAAHITKIDLINNRMIPNAMEPRAANATFSRATGESTLYTTSQNPHLVRLLMCANILQIPETKLRVVAPDVGGGFGSKINVYPEDVGVVWASRALNCPVKWTAERSESFLSDTHGRDHHTHAEMAMDKDGHFLALRVHSDVNLGAYLATFGPAVPTYMYATLLAGQYKTPQLYAEVDAWFTNTAPVDAYRGAGRPEASYVVERIVTRCGWELGLSQDEIRRRNFITEYPYQTPVAMQYDTGDWPKCLDEANKLAEVDSFDQRRKASEAKGLRRGIGYSSYVEACGMGPSRIVGQLGARAGLYESGEVRVNPTGSVTVFTGTHSHGQGHETAFAQLVAARLGVAIENVEVVHGDTNRIPFGMGTYGSRSLAVGGGAIMKALDKIEEKAKKIAAHLLEASDADIEFENGQLTVKGTDKKISFGEVALAAYVPHNYPLEKLEPGLDETAFFDPPNFTFPGGTYICEVEIDPATGVVTIDRFTCVDDFGVIVNPMLVDGQVHGGVMQGIGQALLEEGVYDQETGQLLTGSFMDYTMPRAINLPNFRIGTVCTPCTSNPIGSKGAGEAGAIGAPPAVINAVLDALKPLGVNDIDMPATPFHVWTAIHNAKA
ncbi:MAG: xanthine dehydrogenase family protein molybdopterin-binding subunit [Nevskiaceae bacterium]|nr:MAG: xanthine dehydrogenase family protein molybdopterin-binding subunit [Nevskiaceae bacterium]TBR72547.1 MAG: xanthine dehydrogenase family protein molybdopterin-binding subunit [Nevskiaceae bacterium]